MAQQKQKKILFLCTGNYYRSRFAEILFNSVAGKMGLPWLATSKGLALERGANNLGPMAGSAAKALENLGVHAAEAVSRYPQAVTNEDFAAADRIVALKQAEHQPLLEARFPDWIAKVEFWNVDDAPGALNLVEREVMSLVARILGGGQHHDGDVMESPEPSTPKALLKKPLTVKVGRETAGRRGKGVTTVFDVPLDDSGLRELAATLKQRCGTGGTVKEGRIEIQGDQRERMVAELERLGYKVKRVGG